MLDESGTTHPVRFDRPWTLLRMPQLTWGDRARFASKIGAVLRHGRQRPFDIDDLTALDDGRTLADWAIDTFGERVYEYVIRPLMEPLTGADPTTISAAFTMALLSQPTRTRLTVPSGGLGRISSWLLDGAEVRLSTPALSLTAEADAVRVSTPDGSLTADAVVVATDFRRARALLDGNVDQVVLGALDSVVPISAYHVLLGYQNDPWPDTRHDLVVPAGPGAHHNYGVLLNSRRSAGSTPVGGQTVSVYFDHTHAPGLDERQVVDLAREAVDRAFGPAVPDFHQVFSMDVALIAPVPGHYRKMRAARDIMPDRIRLAGDFLTHSGIESALRSGEQAANDLLVLAQRSGRPLC